MPGTQSTRVQHNLVPGSHGLPCSCGLCLGPQPAPLQERGSRNHAAQLPGRDRRKGDTQAWTLPSPRGPGVGFHTGQHGLEATSAQSPGPLEQRWAPHLRCRLSLTLQVTSQNLASLSPPTQAVPSVFSRGLTEAQQRALPQVSLREGLEPGHRPNLN